MRMHALIECIPTSDKQTDASVDAQKNVDSFPGAARGFNIQPANIRGPHELVEHSFRGCNSTPVREAGKESITVSTVLK